MIIQIYNIPNPYKNADVGDNLEFQLLTVYLYGYFKSAMAQIDETQSFIQFIIVRAIVLSRDPEGKWMADSLEIKHTLENAKAVCEVFTKEIQHFYKFAAFLVQNKIQRRDFIECIKLEARDISNFLLDFENMVEGKNEERKGVHRDNSDNPLDSCKALSLPEPDGEESRKSTPGKWNEEKKTTNPR